MAGQSAALEELGVVRDVVVDEGGDEEEGMVVPRLHPQGQRSARRLARLLEVARQQLLRQELVVLTLLQST